MFICRITLYVRRIMNYGIKRTLQTSGVAEMEGTPLHSLIQLGGLAKYPGATADENYQRASDGNRKMMQLVEELRNG